MDNDKKDNFDRKKLLHKSFILPYTRNDFNFPEAVVDVIMKDIIPPGAIGAYQCKRSKKANFEQLFGWNFDDKNSKNPVYDENNLTEDEISILGTIYKFKFYWNDIKGNTEDKKNVKSFIHFINKSLETEQDELAYLFLDWEWCKNAKIAENLSLINNESENEEKITFFQELKNDSETTAETSGNKQLITFLQKLKNDSEITSKTPIEKIIEEIDNHFPGAKFREDSFSTNTDSKSTLHQFLLDRFRFNENINLEKESFNKKLTDEGYDTEDRKKEDALILEIRDKLFVFFKYFLKDNCQPYFFIYEPMYRSFSYRGLLDNDIVPSDSIRDVNGSVSEFLKELFKHNSDLINDLENKTQEFSDTQKIIFCAEHIRQKCSEGINHKLYGSKKTFWAKNVVNELFNGDFSFSPEEYKSQFEAEIMGIYGKNPLKSCKMVLEPLICNSQYRGNLFIRIDGNDDKQNGIIAKRLLYSISSLGLMISNYIEEFYFEAFAEKTLPNALSVSSHKSEESGSSYQPFVNSVLENLPYLFNTEVAGTFLFDKTNQACHQKNQQLKNRGCELWGFRQNDVNKLWHPLSAEDSTSQCRSFKVTHKRCLWEKLYESCNRLSEDLEKYQVLSFNVHELSANALVENIEEHYKEKELKLDVSQSSSGIILNIFDEKYKKTIIAWLMKEESSIQNEKKLFRCFWAAVDISPEQFKAHETSFKEKIDEVNEIYKKVAHLGKFTREQWALKKQKELSRAWAHSMGNNLGTMKTFSRLAAEDIANAKKSINDKAAIEILNKGQNRANLAYLFSEQTFANNQAVIRSSSKDLFYENHANGKFSLLSTFYAACMVVFYRCVSAAKDNEKPFFIKSINNHSKKEIKAKSNTERHKRHKQKALAIKQSGLVKFTYKLFNNIENNLLECSKDINSKLLTPESEDITNFVKILTQKDKLTEKRLFDEFNVSIDKNILTSDIEMTRIAYVMFGEIMSNVWKYTYPDNDGKRIFELKIRREGHWIEFKCCNTTNKKIQNAQDGHAGNIAIKELLPMVLGFKKQDYNKCMRESFNYNEKLGRYIIHYMGEYNQ